jgi:hypothetical protein
MGRATASSLNQFYIITSYQKQSDGKHEKVGYERYKHGKQEIASIHPKIMLRMYVSATTVSPEDICRDVIAVAA